jgi:hypothetical protein
MVNVQLGALEAWQSAVYPSTHLIRANHGSDHDTIMVCATVLITNAAASTALRGQPIVSIGVLTGNSCALCSTQYAH